MNNQPNPQSPEQRAAAAPPVADARDFLKERVEYLARNEFHPQMWEWWRAFQAEQHEWAPASMEEFDETVAWTLANVRAAASEAVQAGGGDEGEWLCNCGHREAVHRSRATSNGYEWVDCLHCLDPGNGTVSAHDPAHDFTPSRWAGGGLRAALDEAEGASIEQLERLAQGWAERANVPWGLNRTHWAVNGYGAGFREALRLVRALVATPQGEASE